MLELISTTSINSGTCILGLVLGELLHRISLYIEELYHLEEKQYQTSSRISPLSQVFSNKHNQTWKLLVFLFCGILLIIAGEDITSFSILSSLSVNTFAVSAIWACVRMFGITNHVMDDMEIFKDNNAELGPGLATNYWFGFLRVLVQSEDDQSDNSMDDDRVSVSGVGLRQKLREYVTNRMGVGGDHEYFDKIILLLPNSCEFQPETLQQVEHIYKGLPKGNTLNSDVKFKYKEMTKSQTVHWIYKDKEDEQQHPNVDEDASKIFFVFDFPTILRSAMGPGTDQNWSEETRKGNISSFKRTLQSLTCSVGKTRSLSFMDYKSDFEERQPLSFLLRNLMRLSHNDRSGF